MDNITEFIVDYIQREYTIPEEVDILTLDYVEAGYINSIGIIQFIVEIEDEFGISFSDEDLEKPDIRVVGKMAELVREKIRNR